MEYNPFIVFALVAVVAIILVIFVWKNVGNKKVLNQEIPNRDEVSEVLHRKVSFFNRLDDSQKTKFIDRVIYFLSTTRISAEKGAVINNEHKILVAASATIPLFHFNHWSYENLDEVLIYPGTFNEEYNTEESNRNILGMVGDGALHRKMILSLPSIIEGFDNQGVDNTPIHEFVHLIDKADGDVDGVPEYLIPKNLVNPWLKEMHQTISEIKRNKSDIRDYAATNQAEFLAVVSEYFFQKPNRLKDDHPELFELLNEIYSPKE